VADPRDSWNLTGLARQAGAGNAAAVATLRTAFERMTGFHARLLAVQAGIPAANDGLQVAAALADLGRLGLDALGFLGSRMVPDGRWQANADSALAAIAPTRIRQWQLRPVPADAVRLLVEAAKGLPPPHGSP
jgi:hypothetical protein